MSFCSFVARSGMVSLMKKIENRTIFQLSEAPTVDPNMWKNTQKYYLGKMSAHGLWFWSRKYFFQIRKNVSNQQQKNQNKRIKTPHFRSRGIFMPLSAFILTKSSSDRILEENRGVVISMFYYMAWILNQNLSETTIHERITRLGCGFLQKIRKISPKIILEILV